MRQAQFYNLPRSVQDRFIDATRGQGVPKPIAFNRYRNLETFAWAGGALGTAIIWYLFGRVGYGNLDSSLAIAPTWVIVVHILLAAGTTYCALRAADKHYSRTPFVMGTFLFPSGVVVAKSPSLVMTAIEELNDAKAVAGTVILTFAGGKSYSFPIGDNQRAEAVVQTLQQAREKHRVAKGSQDLKELALLDPLEDTGVPNPLAPTDPLTPQRFLPLPALVAVLVIASIGLGCAVFWMRNTRAAKALFAAAVKANTTDAYEAYLERGGEHPDVAGVYLPRAELREAQAKGTVKAIEDYIASHKTTRIGPEVTTAHREALLHALEKAKKTGKLAAVEAIEKNHKGHPLIGAELAQAKQAIYDGALAKFQKEAVKEPVLVAFVTRLIRYSQQHGPTVEVRMRQKRAQNLDIIDDLVRKSQYYFGPTLLPAQYFKGKYNEEREKKLTEKLVTRLQKAFPPDVLHFVAAKPVDSDTGPTPKTKVPTLFIEHSVAFSGGFVGLKRRGMYMGMTLAYRATFTIPGQEQHDLVLPVRKWRAPKIEMIDNLDNEPSYIYGTLAADAYDSFARDFFESWFEKP